MNPRQQVLVVGGLIALVVAGAAVAFPPTQFLSPGEYDDTAVTITDADGTELATVDARVADTAQKRRIGLRRTGTLADGEGMFFVHGSDGEKPYIMPPEMNFSLDIVFIAPDGTVREIRYADAPDGDTTLEYPGRGKYVLEVPRGYTNRTGIGPGDRVGIPENYTGAAGS